jgi:hypothetical protein
MNETVIVALVAFLLVGAIAFYFYARMTYTEKKIGLLESILFDIKMTMETEAHEHYHATAKVEAKAEAKAETETEAPVAGDTGSTNEIISETEYYASVLESANTDVSGNVPSALDGEVEAEVDYDSMSRDELGSLAEKRGLRVTKRMTKATVVSLLREADKNTSVAQESGKDAVEGSNSSLGGIESLDGGAPLDIEADVQV